MKERRLLYAIGWVEDQYIEEMEEGVTRHRSSRFLLLAAVIGILLLLAGCVAVFNWLSTRSIGTESYTWNFDDQGRYQEPEEREMQIMTFYGDSSSSIQKAMKQWYDFECNYDPDGALKPKNNDFVGLERRYETVYACYTQEMADKIDEIARENGLKLLDDWVPFQDYQADIALEGAGFTSLLRPDAQAAITHMAGMLFPPQNMDAEFFMKLTGADAAWTKKVIVGYTYARKDYLPDYGFTSWDITGVQQWKYTSADGTDLLLAQGKTGGGIIVAEQKDAYIIIDITAGNENSTTSEEIMSKKALEQFADVFDYHLVPQVIDASAIWPKLEASEAEYQKAQLALMPSYANFDEYLISRAPYLANSYYCFYDLDADGELDLMLSRDGDSISETVSMHNGEAIETGLGVSKAWLLENGGYLSHSKIAGVGEDYIVKAPYQEGIPVGWTFGEHYVDQFHYGENLVRLKKYHGVWKQYRPNDYLDQGTSVSEEQVKAILAEYPRKTFDWMPLWDYRVGDSTLGEIWDQMDRETTQEKRLEAYRDEAKSLLDQDYEISQYAIRDVNGDGVEDLLVFWDTWEGFTAYTYRYGMLYVADSGSTALCENNIVLVIQNSTLENFEEETTYQFMKYGTRESLAIITYHKAHGTWTDDLQNTSLTESEAQAILAKYPRIKIEKNPIQELIES